MKKCTRCLEVKPLSEFGIRNRVVGGNIKKQYLTYCKKCNSEYSKKRYRDMRSNNLKCIYRFLDIDENVIYVGKTERIRFRMNEHMSKNGHLPKECYDMVNKIQFIAMDSITLMDIKELYYINLYKPRFNKEHLLNEPSFIISDFTKDRWVDYNAEIFKKFDKIKSVKTDKSNPNVYIDKYSINGDNIRFIKSIFTRKRNKNYLVYIEYETVNGKIKQQRKGTFKTRMEADRLVKDLKDIHFK